MFGKVKTHKAIPFRRSNLSYRARGRHGNRLLEIRFLVGSIIHHECDPGMPGQIIKLAGCALGGQKQGLTKESIIG